MTDRPKSIGPDWIKLDFLVPREHAGCRADIFIAHKIPRLSRTRVQRILKKAGFDERHRPIKPNHILSQGERITVYKQPPEEPDVPRYFGVVFEDEAILAVDKPAGLPVHPTARYYKNTLTGLLQERYGESAPFLAHRIDSETSGLIICAKTKQSERAIKILFAQRKVRKRYLAIVHGLVVPPEGKIETPIGPDEEGPIRVKMTCRPDGLGALTEYRTLAGNCERSLLECHPRTGRQHQIRVHLAHLGHPIWGDKMYGRDCDLFLDYLLSGMTPSIEQRAGAKRHYLHASSATFVHPFTNEEITLEAPLPVDMLAALKSTD